MLFEYVDILSVLVDLGFRLGIADWQDVMALWAACENIFVFRQAEFVVGMQYTVSEQCSSNLSTCLSPLCLNGDDVHY